MIKLIEWLGALIFLVAFLEFAANPNKALQSIPEVLATNPRIEDGRLVLRKTPDFGSGNAPARSALQ